MPGYKALFEPFRLKHLTLKNRIMSTAHEPAYAAAGRPGRDYQLYHEEKAKGGVALTIFGGSANIAQDSHPTFGQLFVGDDGIVPYFREFSERIHRHDTALMCQITHMGRRTTWNAGPWLVPVAPSPVCASRPIVLFPKRSRARIFAVSPRRLPMRRGVAVKAGSMAASCSLTVI